MLIDTATLATAGAGLLAGAMSGLHCGAMCGGIVSAHSTLPATIPVRLVSSGATTALPAGPMTRNFAFNAGRIGSYTLAGALAGSLGGATLVMQDSMVLRQILFAMANLMLVALGLYVAGWWRGITILERGGAKLWRQIQPLAAALLKSPITSSRRSLALGAVWGWIPCGLVYAMLVTAMASGSAVNGAIVMLAFGIGTLPNLLLLGWAGVRLAQYLRQPAFRMAAGSIILAFGLFGLRRLPELAKLGGWGALCKPLFTQLSTPLHTYVPTWLFAG